MKNLPEDAEIEKALDTLEACAEEPSEVRELDTFQTFRALYLAQEIAIQVSSAYQKGVADERARILSELVKVEKTAWKDAQHCSCLPYAIDAIKNPDVDRALLASTQPTTKDL